MKRHKTRAKRKPLFWELRLYVADTSANSVLAASNLQTLLDRYLRQRCRFTVIDLVKQPELARAAEIVAVPSLVRMAPGPPKTIIGTLSDADAVLKLLGVQPAPEDLGSALSAAGVSVGSA